MTSANAAAQPPELIDSDHALYEMVDGELREKEMSAWSNYIASVLHWYIRLYLQTHPIGLVFMEATHDCFHHRPGTMRRPDVSFIKFGRTKNLVPKKGHHKVAPDLAVEVVSPSDLAEELAEKIGDYFKAGTAEVWVIYSGSRYVQCYLPDMTTVCFFEGQKIEGRAVLPGFSCAVSDLFADPEADNSQP